MSFQTPNLDGWYDVSDQFRADIHRRAFDGLRRQEEEKSALRLVEDFELRRERVKAGFLRAIGGLPAERGSLNARVTGHLERAGYTIEKTLYESLPGYFVSAACYVPKDLEEPAPAVLLLCGHSQGGKAEPAYQAVCHDLAKNGFLVLAIDPIAQGERAQFFEGSDPAFSQCVLEHTYAGLPFFLVGASMARHFIWDAVRGIDYLASRKDVDATRIGVTGNSGGGTQTCHLMMCDDRVAAAVACCFPTSLEYLLKSGNVQDAEQIVPNCSVLGPDHDDFLTAIAPRPVMAGAVAYDFFPLEGTQRSTDRAREIYRLYGVPENIGLVVDVAHHGYSAKLREAAVNWFKVHLKQEPGDFLTEPFEALPEHDLWATQSGQILRDNPAARSIINLRGELAGELPAAPEDANEKRKLLREVLRLDTVGDRNSIIKARVNESEVAGRKCEKIWFFSAQDVIVAGILFRAEGEAGPVVVLLRESGTNALEDEDRLTAYLDAGTSVFVFDVRGTGGVRTRAVGPLDDSAYADVFNTEYRLACDAIMAGHSTLGLRVFDILRAHDYLKTRAEFTSVSLHGIGRTAVWGYFAGVLEPGLASVTAEEMLTSYRELCASADYDQVAFNLQIMCWGLLRAGDIEDFRPCFAGRELRLVNERDPRG